MLASKVFVYLDAKYYYVFCQSQQTIFLRFCNTNSKTLIIWIKNVILDQKKNDLILTQYQLFCKFSQLCWKKNKWSWGCGV